jgi:hypothetical protein
MSSKNVGGGEENSKSNGLILTTANRFFCLLIETSSYIQHISEFSSVKGFFVTRSICLFKAYNIRKVLSVHMGGGDWIFLFFIQHWFICCPSDSTMSEDAGIEPRTVSTPALAVRHRFVKFFLHLVICFLLKEPRPIIAGVNKVYASAP